jgi:Fe-S cluster biogenesis protein NfuA
MSERIAGEPSREHIAGVVAELLPILQITGGNVEVLAIDRGVVQVRLTGACASCPGSTRAVLMGLEEELRRRVPGVEYLEAVP